MPTSPYAFVTRFNSQSVTVITNSSVHHYIDWRIQIQREYSSIKLESIEAKEVPFILSFSLSKNYSLLYLLQLISITPTIELPTQLPTTLIPTQSPHITYQCDKRDILSIYSLKCNNDLMINSQRDDCNEIHS